MRLPNAARTFRPWRVHGLTRDRRLHDVWALPAPRGPDDFARLVRQFASGDPPDGCSRTSLVLWEVRWRVGELLGWDRREAGPGSGGPALHRPLPAEQRGGPVEPEFDALSATSFDLTDDELAAEGANRTAHGVMYLGRVPDEAGGYRGQMIVLEKPNGSFGKAYMAAIGPFPHLIMYPALMRTIGRERRERVDRIGTEKGELG